MVRPALEPWVEQRDTLSRVRVECLRLRRFEVVAKAAAQPQVVLVVGAAAGGGGNVLDLQSAHDETLRTQAVPATVPRLGSHACPDCFSNVTTAHGCNGSRNPRRTASRSPWALRTNPCW
jgi:hypothetical protein